jgi:hypothetical protein
MTTRAWLQDAAHLRRGGPLVDLVDEYVTLAAAQGAAIVAVLETHVKASTCRAYSSSSHAPARPRICRRRNSTITR